MFALARALAPSRRRILVTTTTRMLNPERASEREGRLFGILVVHPDPGSREALALLADAGARVVLASALSEDGTKLSGVAPEAIAPLLSCFDLVLIEADGARGLSIKAPSEREPVIPSCATAVVGLIGLDALGKSLDDRVAHRPEILGPLVGCAPGEAISPEHLQRLAASPRGLFKGAPPTAKRIVLLNKAELCEPEIADGCARMLLASGATDAVALGALGAPGATDAEGPR
jgi:probable selenium-dependent hydroxylase accessory protein YqeC